MKKFQFICNLFAMAAMATAFVACGGDDTDDKDPQPPTPQIEPTITLTAGEATENSLTFTVTSKDADQVKWMLTENVPTAEEVLANGTAVTANSTEKVTVKDLAPETEYTFYAAAKNADHNKLSAALKMTTLKEEEQATPNSYEMAPSVVRTEVVDGITYDNYKISFSDSDADMTLMLNTYTMHGYKPEGLFVFGEDPNDRTIIFTDSHFVVGGIDKPIIGGEVVFSGSSVEDDLFSVEGIIELKGNEEVEFFYEGPLGLPVAPAGPEHITMNLGSGSAEPGENPGEWVLTLFDDFRNTVVLYCIAPTMETPTNYLPDANYWFCSPDENYSSDKYGWIDTERSYILFAGEEIKVLPRDLEIGRNPSLKFETNYDENSPRDSNTFSTNTPLIAENGLYTFSLSFAGPLYGDGTKVIVTRELDPFRTITEYSTSPDGTKLLLRLYSFYGDLDFCLIIGDGKLSIDGEPMTKDQNGKWVFPTYESFEFDVETEMDHTRSYLFEPALGNGEATLYYFTSGKIRISRSSETDFTFRAIDLEAELTGSTTTYVVTFLQENVERGWSCTLEDNENWDYNWDLPGGSEE